VHPGGAAPELERKSEGDIAFENKNRFSGRIQREQSPPWRLRSEPVVVGEMDRDGEVQEEMWVVKADGGGSGEKGGLPITGNESREGAKKIMGSDGDRSSLGKDGCQGKKKREENQRIGGRGGFAVLSDTYPFG